MKTDLLATDKLTLTAFHERPSGGAEDVTLERSIKDTGIQQPLVVLRVGDDYQLIDGGRRLIIARRLGLPKVPVAVHEVPKGEDAGLYGLKLRFALDEHRQDLFPTQRAQLLQKIKDTRGFGNTELAAYLGVVPESIRNWLSPISYCPEVQDMLDRGAFTMNAARVFEGMTEHGQRYVLKNHLPELTGEGGKDALPARLRAKYPPAKFRNFYTNPEATERNLGLAKQRRAAVRSRVAATPAAEKRKLLESVESKAAEIKDNKIELEELRADITAATPIVAAILRNRELKALLQPEMLEELELFGQHYC